MTNKDYEDEIIKWRLKWITAEGSDLSPSDLEWAIKMEEAFKEQGFLTEKQKKVLEDIYKRC